MRGLADEAGDSTGKSAEARFSALFSEHGRDLMAYALRRASGPEDAADVVAETFLAAWRRAADLPEGEEARLWLYGIARNVLANQRRGSLRQHRLGERLRNELAVSAPIEPAPDAEAEIMRVLGGLDPKDREVLTLAGWEELEPAQIARVLGISAVTARGRLHRARRRLHRALAEAEVPYEDRYLRDLQPGEAR